jgi:hypothetical protein
MMEWPRSRTRPAREVGGKRERTGRRETEVVNGEGESWTREGRGKEKMGVGRWA